MLKSTFCHLAAGLTLLQLGKAIPSSLATRASNIQYLATFEDFKFGALSLASQPAGEYKDVFFNAFNVAKTGSNGLIQTIPGVSDVAGGATGSLPNIQTGVTPHSPPTCISFSTVTRAMQGTPSLTTINSGSPPTKRITLTSFWWGVVLRTNEAVATAPVNALLTVTGFDANNKAVAVDRFSYDVTGLNQEMVFAISNDDFKQPLTHVDFAVDGIGAGIAFSTLFDDITFNVMK